MNPEDAAKVLVAAGARPGMHQNGAILWHLPGTDPEVTIAWPDVSNREAAAVGVTLRAYWVAMVLGRLVPVTPAPEEAA